MAYNGSRAKVGRGTVVSIGSVSGGAGGDVYTPIEELNDATFSGGQWGTAETTNFQSGVDEEFLTTTRNNGEVNLKGNLIDGAPGQAALTVAYNSGSKYDFKVQLAVGPGETTIGTAYTFSALVMSFFDIPVTTKGIVEFTSKLKVSGPITTIAGS